MKNLNMLTFFSVAFMCAFLVIFTFFTDIDIKGIEKNPSPFGIDFAVYYTAGQMVISNNIAEIYNVNVHHDNLEKVLNRKIPFFLSWVYPPTFLLAIVPLSYLPYHFALTLWLIVTLLLVIFAAYLLVSKYKKIAFLVCGFPGVLMNLRWGQNGFLNTALLGYGIYFLERKPELSGLMFGLLSYKPQMAFFPFLLLLLTKKWSVLSWSIIFMFIMSLISVLLFGFDVWINFFNIFFHSSTTLLTSVWKTTSAIQPTFYSALRILGVNDQNLQISLGIVAIITTIAIVWLWRKTDRLTLRGSALVLGILLTMPYYMQYDLMILSIPLLLLSYDCLEYGYHLYELILLGGLWLMPMINWPLVILTNIQICPFVLIAIFAMLIVRAQKSNEILNL